MKHRAEFLMISAAMGFSLGGIGAKILREADMDAFRLTQIRTTGAAIILLTIAFITGKKQLRIKQGELKDLIIFGVIGVAMESQEDPKQIYKVGLNTSRLLMATGELIIAWLLLQQADIATTKLANPGRDKDFFDGKIASAKFFVRSVLPHITVERAVVESETGEIMEISEAAF